MAASRMLKKLAERNAKAKSLKEKLLVKVEKRRKRGRVSFRRVQSQ